MRAKLGAVWAVITLWIMALDPANLFPSRLDWGPTVLMHFFQAAIFALWFSYRDRPKLWKIVLILICAVLGFFDKFNFIWLIGAFVIALCLCYPDTLKNLWFSTPRLLAGQRRLFLLSRCSRHCFWYYGFCTSMQASLWSWRSPQNGVVC